MEIRRFVATYPLPTLLTGATVVAVAWTVRLGVLTGLSRGTLRAAALSTVLATFAVGFWAGPLIAWYDDRA